MDKLEALEHIKTIWNSLELSLGDKIIMISTDYYSVGLDLPTTAAYIKATPAEFEAFLSLSELDDDIIGIISKINPPKTTWTLLANASESEIRQALSALEGNTSLHSKLGASVSEFVYQQMLEVAEPTIEQKIGMLSGQDLAHILKKGTDFNAFDDWSLKFFKSIAAQKKRGKVLSDKQLVCVVKILNTLADKGVLKRNSIDGDRDVCDRILDALER